MINYLENVFFLPCMQPSWISVDFDNWRDWENEEDEGKVEYDQYVDVSIRSSNQFAHVLCFVAIFILTILILFLKRVAVCLFYVLFLCSTLPDPLLDDSRNGQGQ